MLLELKQHISTHVYKSFSSISIHFCPQILYYLSLRILMNSKISADDKNLEIAGYKFVREDHSSNSKRGGVCVYYKSSLPFRVINVKYLQESISFELRIGGKCCKFSCLYRSPSQTQDEFETFLKNFESTLDKIHESNPFMTVIQGDFNAKSNNWCKADVTFLDGSKIDTITSSSDLNELIQEPDHILICRVPALT